jgi:hypothetical protein
MNLAFKHEDHSYYSLDPMDGTVWTSVTTFVSKFKQKFDPVAQSLKSSKNKKSKWYGMDPAAIQAIWSSESHRAMDLGNWYHGQRESDITSLDTIDRGGRAVPIVKPIYDNDLKIAPEQRLVEGIYPEHFVYLKSINICGQSDRVEVVNGLVDIVDYKTNKEIKKESFKNWDGVSQKMQPPISHLDDCNYWHYALQLSIYMYIILRHNPNLKPGKLTLHHVVFMEAVDKDRYGNPITLRDYAGNPIVKDVVAYEVPYLKDEVMLMIKHKQAND